MPTLRYLAIDGDAGDYEGRRRSYESPKPVAVLSFKSSGHLRDLILGYGDLIHFGDKGLYPLNAFDGAETLAGGETEERPIEDLRDSLKGLLEWTQRKASSMTSVGDRRGVERLMGLVKDLREEQLAEMV